MQHSFSQNLTTAAAVAGLTAALPAAEVPSLEAWLADLTGQDDPRRLEALNQAARMGAKAVPALANRLGDPEVEAARAAKRALFAIVHHAGRPGATSEAGAVEFELIKVLNQDRPVQVRRELLWMLSEIGHDAAVDTVATFLGHRELRDDARCVLQRIPGDKSLDVLKTAHAAATDDFKKNLAESLLQRGLTVPGFQSEKLKPVKS